MRFLFFACCYFIILSCVSTREASCEEAAEANRNDEINIIVSKSSQNPYQFELSGIDPVANESARFKQVNYTWAQWFIDDISIGDTVVKNRGELKFYIHKKDTVLVFPFECKGEIYE